MASQLPAGMPSPNIHVPPPQVDRGKLIEALRAVGRFLTAPLRFSLAGRASFALFLFLVVLVTVVWILLKRDPNVVTWQSFMSPWRLVAVALLAIATPVAVYFALRLWLQGDISRFPDIDYAWKAGMDALRENAIPLNGTPLFLILGSTNEAQEKAIMDAAGLRMRVACTPEGPAPLHWYGNPDGIFLFCTESCLLSAFSRIEEKNETSTTTTDSIHFSTQVAPVQPVETGTPAKNQLFRSRAAPVEPVLPSAPARRPEGGGDQPSGTIMLDQFLTVDQEQSPPPPGVTEATGDSIGARGRGTVTLPGPVPSPESVPRPAPTAPQPAAPTAQPSQQRPDALDQVVISSREATNQLQRLQYVCHQLRLARQPLCPINGVLTLIPFEGVQARAAADELKRAIKSDVGMLQQELDLRCPVTALIVGLESERGFRELVRRVGSERASSQRFGRRYDVRTVATPEQLQALSAHVCGAFEDWIYTLFREQGALSRPGNTKLYSLLCKIRCTLKTRLGDVLSGGFGYDERRDANDTPIPFSGCYFAATGPTADRQAFVRGVVDKLLDEQEQVEWTQRAISRDLRYYRFAALGIATNVALAATLAAMLLSQL